MGQGGRIRWATAVAVTGAVLASAACSGGGSTRSAKPRPKSTTTAPTTTTSPAPTTMTAAPGFLIGPIPAGALHGTPQPSIENTGTDYVAIYTSLDYFFRWLQENPDPALVRLFVDEHGPLYADALKEMHALADNAQRTADANFRLISATVVSIAPEFNGKPINVALRVTLEGDSERVVDANGRELSSAPSHGPIQDLVVLVPGTDGRWRWNELDRISAPGVIQQ